MPYADPWEDDIPEGADQGAVVPELPEEEGGTRKAEEEVAVGEPNRGEVVEVEAAFSHHGY